jgi:hypothetical protein
LFLLARRRCWPCLQRRFFSVRMGGGKSHLRMTALSQDPSFRLINAAVRFSAEADA